MSRRARWAMVVVILIALLPLLGRLAIGRLGGAWSGSPAELRAALSVPERARLDELLAGLPDKPLFDMHTHVVGLGAGGTGNEVHSRMRSWRHPAARAKFLVYTSAAGVTDESRADQQYVDRLRELIAHSPRPSRHLLLAFDRHYDKDGEVDSDKTEFHVPNRQIFRLAEQDPEHLLPAMSIHPLRPTAIADLERYAARGGRVVKWLPNAMGIDPADPRCDPFYRAMVRLRVVLLSHAGEEQAVEAEEDQELGNPLRLRRALERGVTVVVAHCASLGRSQDLDDSERPAVPSFELFARMMDDPRWRGRLFGELSALTQFNRLQWLPTILARRDWQGRLLNGSDYPLPAVNIVIRTGALARAGLLAEADRGLLVKVYDHNPLLFDLAVKLALRHPETGLPFDRAIFCRGPEDILSAAPAQPRSR